MKIFYMSELKEFLAGNSFFEYIVCSENITPRECESLGVKYSIKFNNMSVYCEPKSILFSGDSCHMSLSGVETVNVQDHVLGILLEISLSTGVVVSVICR